MRRDKDSQHISEEDLQSLLSRSFCHVSFAIHPAFYQQEAVMGGTATGPLKMSSKDFCLCRGCQRGALRVCLGDVEPRIEKVKYPSGLEQYWFTCEVCKEQAHNQKCCICDEADGLMKKLHTSQWIHYTCALFSPQKARTTSVSEMKFELHEEAENVRRTRHKKDGSAPVLPFYLVLKRQAEDIVTRVIEPDDPGLATVKFSYTTSQEGLSVSRLIEGKEMADTISNNLEFGVGSKSKPKKSSKKKKNTSGTESAAINVTSFLTIDSKEAFITQLQAYSSDVEEEKASSANHLHPKFTTELIPGDPARGALYCKCWRSDAPQENFISCDECQVWYHCGCVGINLDLMTDSDTFVCSKCRSLKQAEDRGMITLEDIEKLKLERLTLDEAILLCFLAEKSIASSVTRTQVSEFDIGPIDLSYQVGSRQSEILVSNFFCYQLQEIMNSWDLSSIYQEGSIDNDQFVKLRTAVQGGRTIYSLIESLDLTLVHTSFLQALTKCEIALQYYEEIRPKVLRIPVLLSIAKQAESHPELKELAVHKNFLAALRTSKGKLDLILNDFRTFSAEVDAKLETADIVGVQLAKIDNTRVAEYKSDLAENPLAFRIVESMLLDFGVSEAEKNSEIPLKLDHFLVVLRRELTTLVKAGESDVIRVWQDKRHLFQKSKVIVQKVQKLKTELPNWRELAELSNPEEVFPSRQEVNEVLLESEESVLVMNSATVKKLQDLKTSSAKFDKKNQGDFSQNFESAKRHLFNMMKAGVLFNEDLLALTKELQIHNQVVKFCSHRAWFSIEEIEEVLQAAQKKFEPDLYEKATLLLEEIKVFVAKAIEVQDRHDLWTDRVLEESLKLGKKLLEYRVRLPQNLERFSMVNKAVNWLMGLADLLGIEENPPITGGLLRRPFSSTLDNLLRHEKNLDEINIRSFVKLEKSHPPGVFSLHPDLLRLSTYTAKRIWQKEVEDLESSGAGPFHVDDIKHVLRRWFTLQHDLTSIPEPINYILDRFRSFKLNCYHTIKGEIEYLPFAEAEIMRTQQVLSEVTSYVEIGGLSQGFEDIQASAIMMLSFGIQLHKVSLYMDEQKSGEQVFTESAQLSSVSQLMSKVYENLEVMEAVLKGNIAIISPEWQNKFKSMAVEFQQKVSKGVVIINEAKELQEAGEKVLSHISNMRKEKPLNFANILEEIQKKPTLKHAQEVYYKLENFSQSLTDSAAPLKKVIDEAHGLEESLNSLITVEIPFENSPENKTKFQQLEKDFLRLLKKAELLLIYNPKFNTMFQAANVLYKIKKLYFDPATQRKWAKVKDSLAETFAACPDAEPLVRPTVQEFKEQFAIVEKLTERLMKEKLNFKDIKEIVDIAQGCKADAIGDVEVKSFAEECAKLVEEFESVKEATGKSRVSLDIMENLKQVAEDFDLAIEDSELDRILELTDNHKSLLKMLQIAQKEGMLSHGPLLDFVHDKYSESVITSKPIEELLSGRLAALGTFQQIENNVCNLSSDAYLDFEPRILTVKPTWENVVRKLFIMFWLRKVSAIKEHKMKANLLNLECMIEEAAEVFEKSKKLSPAFHRMISEILCPRTMFLEELLAETDKALGVMAKSTSIRQLEEAQQRFREKDRVDLSSTMIDMSTQLNLGGIEFISKRRTPVAIKMKEAASVLGPEKELWDLNLNFKSINEIFDALAKNDRKVLETRFIEMFESGSSFGIKDFSQLSFEGQMLSREESVLSKRKPQKPGIAQHTGLKRAIDMTRTDDGQPLVNTVGVSNLSHLTADNDAITDVNRELVFNHLFTLLKENPHFGCEEGTLRSSAKSLEVHLFSNEYKSKTSYQRASFVMREILEKMARFEMISKEFSKQNFSYDYLLQMKEKPEQRWIAQERDLKAVGQNQEVKYNPLGGFFSSKPDTGSSKKENSKLSKALIQSQSDKNMLKDVLQQLASDPSSKKSNLMKALMPKPKPRKQSGSEEKSVASKSRSKGDRSRSRSVEKDRDDGKRRFKRDRSRDRAEKRDKKKKKKDEKAKFSSDSDGQEEEDGNPRAETDQGTYWPLGKPASPTKDGMIGGVPEDRRPHKKFSSTNGGGHSRPPKQIKPPILAGTWYKLEYPKNKIRIFVSEAKKKDNEGYSVACNLNTSEADFVITQFPELQKQPTFIFDKYERNIEEIEHLYAKKARSTKKGEIPDPQTIMGGWITPSDEDPKHAEKLSNLENYLSNKHTSLTYQPTSGLVIFVMMGKHLKGETLKALGVKTAYESGQITNLDNVLIYFLRRTIDKEPSGVKRLKCSVVQEYDRMKEGSLKYHYEPRKEVIKEKHDNGANSAQASAQKDAPLDPQMASLLAHFKNLDEEGVKDLINSLDEGELKQKLFNIINLYLPQFKHVIPAQPGSQPIPSAPAHPTSVPAEKPNPPYAYGPPKMPGQQSGVSGAHGQPGMMPPYYYNPGMPGPYAPGMYKPIQHSFGNNQTSGSSEGNKNPSQGGYPTMGGIPGMYPPYGRPYPMNPYMMKPPGQTGDNSTNGNEGSGASGVNQGGMGPSTGNNQGYNPYSMMYGMQGIHGGYPMPMGGYPGMPGHMMYGMPQGSQPNNPSGQPAKPNQGGTPQSPSGNSALPRNPFAPAGPATNQNNNELPK